MAQEGAQVTEVSSTFDAIEEDSLAELSRHLDSFPETIESKKDGSTMLLFALLSGSFNCARELLRRGANLHAVSDSGCTAFQMLNFISTPNTPGYDEMLRIVTPTASIHEATRHGLIDRVHELVMQQPEQVHERDSAKWTPLMTAAYHGQVELVRFFLQDGADVNAYEYDGQGAVSLNCAGYRGEDSNERERQIEELLQGNR